MSDVRGFDSHLRNLGI